MNSSCGRISSIEHKQDKKLTDSEKMDITQQALSC